MSDNIPKTIHYCWFGNKEKSKIVKECIESWKEKCPDYEIREWNENNFDININKYVSEAYQMKKYAFLADYARLWIVYNFGGIYFDTDVELIKNIDDLLKYEAFFASEDNIHINTGLGFGAKKNNKLIKTIMHEYENISFIQKNGTIDKTTCTVRNTRIIKEYYNNEIYDFSKSYVKDNMCFLPKEYFCPLNHETGKMNKTENTYGIHWFSGTWMNWEDKLKRIARRFLNKYKPKEGDNEQI